MAIWSGVDRAIYSDLCIFRKSFSYALREEDFLLGRTTIYFESIFQFSLYLSTIWVKEQSPRRYRHSTRPIDSDLGYSRYISICKVGITDQYSISILGHIRHNIAIYNYLFE